MSFSSLPPELVHQIIESTVSHTFHSTTYEERQHTLCRLCLVSKAFRLIAQPLLFGIVRLTNSSMAKFERSMAARDPASRATLYGVNHWVVMDNCAHFITSRKVEDWTETRQILSKAQRVITSVSYFDFFMRDITSNLTSLQVSDNAYNAMPPNLLLPHLEDLTLENVDFDLLSALLRPEAVPRLRNLGLINLELEFYDWLEMSTLEQLLPQLGTLTINSMMWEQIDRLHSSVASRTLVDVGYHCLRTLCTVGRPPHHIRLDNLPPVEKDRSDGNKSQMSVLCGCIEYLEDDDYDEEYYEVDRRPFLQSFYLDSSFQHTPSLQQPLRETVEHFFRICHERKIDLVFEQLPAGPGHDDPYISPEFVKRQRNSTRERACEGGEEGGTSG